MLLRDGAAAVGLHGHGGLDAGGRVEGGTLHAVHLPRGPHTPPLRDGGGPRLLQGP